MWLRGRRTVLECGRDEPLMFVLKQSSTKWLIHFSPCKNDTSAFKIKSKFIYSNTVRYGWSEWEICGNIILFHENVSVTLQIWKREASLDRDLLLCEAAGREIHQVNAALTTEEYECLACLSALMSNNCLLAAPCWGCPSSSSPHEEPSLCRWLRTGKIYLNSVLWDLLLDQHGRGHVYMVDVSSLVVFISGFCHSLEICWADFLASQSSPVFRCYWSLRLLLRCTDSYRPTFRLFLFKQLSSSVFPHQVVCLVPLQGGHR